MMKEGQTSTFTRIVAVACVLVICLVVFEEGFASSPTTAAVLPHGNQQQQQHLNRRSKDDPSQQPAASNTALEARLQQKLDTLFDDLAKRMEKRRLKEELVTARLLRDKEADKAVEEIQRRQAVLRQQQDAGALAIGESPGRAAALRQDAEDMSVLADAPVAGLPTTDECMRHHKATENCTGAGIVPLLITGVGRSGTHHTENALRRKGINVCHEAVCTNGSVSWTYAVVDPGNFYPWEASGYRIASRRFAKIFHQVRHPLKSIASLTTFEALSWSFIGKHTPSVPNLAEIEPPTLRALIHWVTWNRMIEQYADFRYRMEDTPVEFICREAGYPLARCYRAINESKVRRAERQHTTLTWAQLEALDARYANIAKVMARRYGYDPAEEGGDIEED